jgi:CheY-like chemotaxis protein
VIRAVLVSAVDLSRDLRATVLFRENVERLSATAANDVKHHAAQGRVDVIVVDSAISGAAGLVAALRHDPLTRPTAIVALGRSEFGLGQLDMLQAGANAILPLPPGADWDDRLMRLVHVPNRKHTRLPVDFAIEGGLRGGLRFRGGVMNLSVHGLLLECTDEIQIGDDLRLEFELPGGHGQVRGTGTVVREAQPRSFGVELTHIEGDGRVRIKRYVESSAD